MRLKRLTLHGFKSFADRTEFVFSAGLTGIIGPNGCGKSNVVDATKWVLGDQRPTSLRGQDMQDLIFNGAEGRPPMGCSEVILTLERPLDAEQDKHGNNGGSNIEEGESTSPVEMTVGRRLYRSGESEYLLNNKVVRLKDVREAIMDTGLGVGTYSVMEQGKIDAILSANPEDRRVIFDEAAGISRFKAQRKEALRKLDRTLQNLARVGDLRREKGSRVRSLKIQATKARNYRETAERLMALRVAVAFGDSVELSRMLAGSSSVLDEAQATLAVAEKERNELRSAVHDGDSDTRELQERHGDARELLTSLRGDEKSRLESLERGEERRRRLAELIEDARLKREELALESLGVRTDLAMTQTELTSLAAKQAVLDEELPARKEAATMARRDFKRAQTQREACQTALLEVIHERSMAKNRVLDEEHACKALNATCKRLAKQIQTLDLKLLDSRREGRKEKFILWDLDERKVRVEERTAKETGKLRELEQERGALGKSLAALARKHSEITTQISLLAELEASLTGLDEAARELLERDKGIRGRLVEAIDCPLQLGAALEAALGERVQALCVDGFKTVHAAFAALGDAKKGGRLVLLDVSGEQTVPDSMTQDSAAQGSVAQDSNVVLDPAKLGTAAVPLLQFLRLGNLIRKEVSALLAHVFLVRDLETARRRSRADAVPARIYVTLRGEICEGAWTRGGRVEQAAGLVQRRSALEALKKDDVRVNSELQALRKVEGDLVRRLERKFRLQRRLEELGEAIARKLVGLGQRLDARQHRETELRDERNSAAEELGEAEKETVASLVRMMQPLLGGMLLQKKEQRLECEQSQANRELLELDQAVHRSQDHLALLQSQKAAADAELAGGRERASLLERSCHDLERRGKQLEEEAQENLGERESGAESLALWRSELVDFGCRADFVEASLEALAKSLTAMEASAEERRERLLVREALVERLRDQRGEHVLKQRECKYRLLSLDQEIRAAFSIELPRLRGERQGYGLWHGAQPLQGPSPEAENLSALQADTLLGPPAPPGYYGVEQNLPHLWEDEDFNVQGAEKEVMVLQARMQRMGAVNLAAEAELEDAESTFLTLERDCRDLEEAQKQLMETLRRLNAESKERFEKTFMQVRENFQEIFRMLFQGGKADIQLLEADDPLETGIEILARPPGKELQSIRLLSGGERSLTALAILFAVFKVKPSPFCILDEVDAALDDTNVDRFLKVLAGFAKTTQFLVITHHKRTMLDCNVLYGVTMQRRGISSRMAVSLEQVESGRVDRMLEAVDPVTGEPVTEDAGTGAKGASPAE